MGIMVIADWKFRSYYKQTQK